MAAAISCSGALEWSVAVEPWAANTIEQMRGGILGSDLNELGLNFVERRNFFAGYPFSRLGSLENSLIEVSESLSGRAVGGKLNQQRH
jgi:hypothetical protein